MTATDSKPKDDKEEVDQLRERVEVLAQPVPPAVAGVADQASEYAKQAYDAVNEQTEWLAARTRQSPIVTLGVACAVGYVLGRLVR